MLFNLEDSRTAAVTLTQREITAIALMLHAYPLMTDGAPADVAEPLRTAEAAIKRIVQIFQQ